MILENANLGEQRCPYGLNLFDAGGLDEGLELFGLGTTLALVAQSQWANLYSDVDTVIGEDEGRVRGGKFGGRHGDCVCGRVVEEMCVLKTSWLLNLDPNG